MKQIVSAVVPPVKASPCKLWKPSAWRFLWFLVVAAHLQLSQTHASAAPLTKVEVLKAISDGGLRGMHDTLGGEQEGGYEYLALRCKKPEIWSGDFGFSAPELDVVDRLDKRDAQLQKIIRLGEEGRIITLSWHQCSPILGEPCTFLNGVHGQLSGVQWDILLTQGSDINVEWTRSVDVLFRQLDELRKRNITVLLRPLHEMNVPGMWWHGTYQQSKRLWEMLRERLGGLDNVIWVWSVTYHPRWVENMMDYYPGDALVDVIGVDIYPAKAELGPPFAKAREEIERIFPRKLIALTEVSKLPEAAEFELQRWAYVVPWGLNMLERLNSDEQIKSFYRCQSN